MQTKVYFAKKGDFGLIAYENHLILHKVNYFILNEI